ncbi:transcriptional repressor LexA [soil metagenome]
MTKQDQQRADRILTFVGEYTADKGYPPSVREIAHAVGLASTSAVHHHLIRLEEQGRLQKQATRSRALSVTGMLGASRLVHAFVRGEVSAGGGVFTYEEAVETMALPSEIAAKPDSFVLRVRGESMIGDHIQDGDYVVVQPQATARDGDIVVAILEDGTATLKRFFKEKDRVRLQPSNSAVPTIIQRDVKIQGKCIGVIRRLT